MLFSIDPFFFYSTNQNAAIARKKSSMQKYFNLIVFFFSPIIQFPFMPLDGATIDYFIDFIESTIFFMS